MTPEAAKLALQFLNRVPLRGDEVDAFAVVRTALRTVAFPQPDPVPAESAGGTD